MQFLPDERELHWKAQLRVYQRARMHVMLVLVLSVVSTIFMVTSGGVNSILFSAFLPYHLLMNGMYACGLLAPAYYPPQERYFVGSGLFYGYLIATILLLVLYLLCFLGTKRGASRGWMVLALVLFAVDTLDLLIFGSLTSVGGILDLAFHAWVLSQLFLGVRAAGVLSHPPLWGEELLPPSLRRQAPDAWEHGDTL